MRASRLPSRAIGRGALVSYAGPYRVRESAAGHDPARHHMSGETRSAAGERNHSLFRYRVRTPIGGMAAVGRSFGGGCGSPPTSAALWGVLINRDHSKWIVDQWSQRFFFLVLDMIPRDGPTRKIGAARTFRRQSSLRHSVPSVALFRVIRRPCRFGWYSPTATTLPIWQSCALARNIAI